jgi:alkyl hydroperoxide reductase subunit F
MTPQVKDSYDVVIIGGGPAGLAAAVYTARQGLATVLVAGELGGQAVWATKVENYLGYQLIAGADLVRHFREHVSRFPVDCLEGQYVNAVVPSGDGFEAYTREGTRLVGRAVIIATGRAPARLAVPGERELVGRGVSYCATCDGAFFRGRPVAVIGPGEAAAEAALQLATLEARVLLVTQRPLRVDAELLAKLEAEHRIRLRSGMTVVRIEGDERVTGVTLKDREGEHEIAVDAVFIETGSIPAEELTGGLVKVNEKGEIEVGRDTMTSHPGIFAAGDVTDDFAKQIIIAAGEGARAGVAAARWLQRR